MHANAARARRRFSDRFLWGERGTIMRVRLLGPVELLEPDGSSVLIAAPKRRAVLAVLALEMNRVVPVERLLDLIWDGAPPPRARTALQGHVSALRRLLTAPGLTLVTRDPGYALLGAASEVDLHLFRSCYEQAAGTEDDRTAADLLAQALGPGGAGRWPTSPAPRSATMPRPGSASFGSPPWRPGANAS